LNARLTTVQCTTAVSGAVAAIFLSWLLQHTKWGTTVRAVASDTDLSSIAGLKVPRIRLTVFALASACAAVAAILDAYNTDVTPEMGFHLMLMGITACIIGGIGSIRGAYLGAFLIALVQQVTAWCWSAQWQDVGIFIILILTLLIRPQGFFGVPLRQAHA
jgi:branched-chain amino acid transport system permease protein